MRITIDLPDDDPVAIWLREVAAGPRLYANRPHPNESNLSRLRRLAIEAVAADIEAGQKGDG